MSYLYEEPDLGYVFYPPSHPGDPGHPRLDVFLRQVRTEHHFDVSTVHFSVFSSANLIDRFSVSLHHLGPFEGKVCPGRIILESFDSKTVDAFTFGGQFQVEMRPDLTLCTIRSEAPILEIVKEETVASMLAQEVEILLASRRAAWAQNPDALAMRLAKIDSITLYHASLEELDKKFKLLPHMGDPLNVTFTQFLATECREFQNKYWQGGLNEPFEALL
jgi:hypothetical protein